MKQVAIADRLVLTKTDLLDGAPDGLAGRLAALNPSAPVLTARFGEIDAERLFDMGTNAASGRASDLHDWLRVGTDAHGSTASRQGHDHDADITCFAIVREAPIPAVALTLLLEVLAEHCGGDLLRLKGIVNIAESPDRPAVVHGVQHVFHPPAWLDRWPSDDRRSRLVFIARRIPQRWVEVLLEAIDAEVSAVTAE